MTPYIWVEDEVRIRFLEGFDDDIDYCGVPGFPVDVNNANFGGAFLRECAARQGVVRDDGLCHIGSVQPSRRCVEHPATIFELLCVTTTTEIDSRSSSYSPRSPTWVLDTLVVISCPTKF